MTSLRKRVSSYLRQLSFHNEPRERKTNSHENSFITKYLMGQISLKDGPPVLYGKTPNDLPNFELGSYSIGTESIVGCSTGPNGGLTTVKRVEKHLSVTDPDIDFIDTQEEIAELKSKSPVPLRKKRPLDNTTMAIKVAGQTYQVSNRKSRSLGSLTDLTTAGNEGNKNLAKENNNETDQQCKNQNSNDDKQPDSDGVNKNFNLSKSKSECNPFDHKKKGKIIRLSERPNTQGSQGNSHLNNRNDPSSFLPEHWNRKTDLVYGVSDSLYDVNQVTKCKNGNPIADCYGIIARSDSAILALADGVNWGEKACIAAKSAVHGCLHYLNKTIFDDTTLFDFSHPNCSSPTANSPINTCFTPPPSMKHQKSSGSPTSNENRISNTTEVFISILRAFNCAHNLILENEGMLTTLTVAVVLPLKSSNYKKLFKAQESTTSTSKSSDLKSGDHQSNEKYICCVCNVGDTLAYVYSPKYGVREITKGSHDVHCNRDMRDALGALGPVDGINPELNNLTLSVTTVEAGDIVMIASDGLTDNYDPTVCKYTVNSALNETNKSNKTSNISHMNKDKSSSSRLNAPAAKESRPPRDRKVSSRPKEQTPTRATNVSRLANASMGTTNIQKNKENKPSTSNETENKNKPSGNYDSTSINKENNFKNTEQANKSGVSFDTVDNPLIAQFIADHGFEPPKNSVNINSRNSSQINPKSKRVTVPNVLSEKKVNPLSKSSSASGVCKNKVPETGSKYNFLRSKTSLDLHPQKIIPRNEDGLPFVTPIQKYELTLLLIEDILRRGISGKDCQCTTAKILCENLLKYTISITAAKRRTLEDLDLYFDNKNDILVEISQKEKKIRRKRCLEKVQTLPGKLDHVSVVAYNVGNKKIEIGNQN